MSQVHESRHRTFTSGSTLARYLRVKTPAAVVVAGAADVELGVVANAVVASGDPVDVILNNFHGTHPMVASGAVSVGANVYGDAAGKVTATANGNPVGISLTAASANGDVIEVLRLPLLGGKLFTQTTASSAVSNTTTETAFDQSFTIPANLLGAGDRLRIRGQGIATATNSTDTLTAKLKIGSTVIASTGALDVANNDIFVFDADLVIRTAGAGGTLVAAGEVSIGTSGTATAKPFILASTAIDTTANQLVAVTATWSVANAGDSCRLDVLNVERLPA